MKCKIKEVELTETVNDRARERGKWVVIGQKIQNYIYKMNKF